MIKEVLMRRDNMSEEQAEQEIIEARALLQEYLFMNDLAAAEDICAELWGLEPDYIMELLP